MNNKGFTLMELLVVVAILGIVGTVITVSLMKTFKDTNQATCDEFIKEVEDAACVYASKNNQEVICKRGNCAPLKLDVLIKEGLIESEIDSCTGKNIDINKTVTVTWNNEGEKSCYYNGVREYAR